MKDVDRIAQMIERRLPLRILQLVEDDEPERSPLQKLWDTATKHETWKTCMAKAVGEVSPPGWEGTVNAMKGHPDITNPWALAWWMDGQGMSSHNQSEKEGGPGSGRKGGGAGKYVPQHIANARADQARLQRHDRAEKGRRAALKRGARGDNSTIGILRQRGYDV